MEHAVTQMGILELAFSKIAEWPEAPERLYSLSAFTLGQIEARVNEYRDNYGIYPDENPHGFSVINPGVDVTSEAQE